MPQAQSPQTQNLQANTPQTMFDRIWDAHVAVARRTRTLLTLDRVLLHDMTSGPAFDTLRARGLRVAHPGQALAVVDHTADTATGRTEQSYPTMAGKIDAFRKDARQSGIRFFGLDDPGQGIVHVVAAEQGAVLPGMTVVCGDSHTCTNGALGAIAFGIGGTDIAHSLAYQALWMPRPRPIRVTVQGTPGPHVTAKDIALAIIARFSTDGGTGAAVEYAGEAIRTLSIEERMTLCNLSIEFGSRIGLIAPDDAAFKYLHGKPRAPKGLAFDAAVTAWRGLASDEDAVFEREYTLDARDIAPMVSWGTSPEDAVRIDGRIPSLAEARDDAQRQRWTKALGYVGLQPGQPIAGVPIDVAFIGSCTNARLSDLRAAAAVVAGRKVAAGVRALVVPGSSNVKRQAEAEGLDRIFHAAGFEWHESGCSLCVSLGPDNVGRGQRCASTSNRNFENRQGPGAITHLMSPAMVAASAITGAIADVRKLPRLQS